MRPYRKPVMLISIALTVLFCCTACKYRKALPAPTEETKLTNAYGNEIPVYSDVSLSDLDPALFIRNENGRFTYADPTVRSYTGVDVSTFQGEIDWDAVQADGIDFAMLRVGYRGYGPEGKLGDDDRFAENYKAAAAAGLKVGVYFFSQAISPEEAREEADFVLSRTADISLDYPIAYDWERIDYDTARTDSMTSEQISACAAAFCDEIAAHGYDALIYFNRELGYFNYDLSVVNSYHFWLAEYLEKPTFIYDYKMWQYTKTGSVRGIDGNVDLNICVYNYGGVR